MDHTILIRVLINIGCAEAREAKRENKYSEQQEKGRPSH